MIDFEEFISNLKNAPELEKGSDTYSPLNVRVQKLLRHWSSTLNNRPSYMHYPEIKQGAPIFPHSQTVKLSDIVTKKVVDWGIYNTPHTFSDFKTHRRNFYFKIAQETDKPSIVLLATVANALGFLGIEEVPYDSFLKIEPQINYQYISRPNLSAGGVRLPNQHVATNVISRWINSGYVTAEYMGTFDLNHKAHKRNAEDAKKLLGSRSKIIAAVAENKESIIVKQKEPIRSVDDRLDDILGVVGIDAGFPIKINESIDTKKKLVNFYTRLHYALQPHIRICGHPKTINPDLLQTYIAQCKTANILLLTNDKYIEMSTSSERAKMGV